MDTTTVIIVVLVVVAALAVVAALVAGARARQRKREALQERFGSEYERAMEERGSRRRAESELDDRTKRRERFELRPLDPARRDESTQAWHRTQEEFVDDPGGAVQRAHGPITEDLRRAMVHYRSLFDRLLRA
ncbi:MAG: hypothetical protein ACRDU8_07330 [Egibacteraceae bacterium]